MGTYYTHVLTIGRYSNTVTDIATQFNTLMTFVALAEIAKAAFLFLVTAGRRLAIDVNNALKPQDLTRSVTMQYRYRIAGIFKEKYFES